MTIIASLLTVGMFFSPFLLLAGSVCKEAESQTLSNIKQLTFFEMGFERAGEAYFSPDEKMIAFQAVPVNEEEYQIYVMDIEEGIPRMISTGKGACTCAYFRPDGKKIIFASSHEDPFLSSRKKESSATYKWDFTPYMNVYESNLDGSELKALTSGPAYHAECAYSSDGKEIVYASNEDGTMNLYVMEADGSSKRQLTFDTACYNGGPFFSPDNQFVIYRSDKLKKDYLQIYKISSDGREITQLTDNGAVNWAPYWHPNGQIVAFTTSLHGHHRYEIYLIDVFTKKTFRVTYHAGFDGLPVFSSSGNKLMWTSKRGIEDSCQIFIADFQMPDQFKPNLRP